MVLAEARWRADRENVFDGLPRSQLAAYDLGLPLDTAKRRDDEQFNTIGGHGVVQQAPGLRRGRAQEMIFPVRRDGKQFEMNSLFTSDQSARINQRSGDSEFACQRMNIRAQGGHLLGRREWLKAPSHMVAHRRTRPIRQRMPRYTDFASGALVSNPDLQTATCRTPRPSRL